MSDDLLLRFASPPEAPASVVAFATDAGFDPTPDQDWRISARLLRAELERRHAGEVEWLVFLNQVHGGRVLMVDDPTHLPGAEIDHESGAVLTPEADGAVTDRRGIALVVRTADCLPVLVWDSDGAGVGAAHAGWRGSMEAISSTLVLSMEMLGVRAGSLSGWIGPRIDGACYEVDWGLIEKFQERHGHLGAFTKGRLLDLVALNRAQAAAAGMQASLLEDSGLCTYTSSGRYPSHRRDGARRGRIHTVVFLRGIRAHEHA